MNIIENQLLLTFGLLIVAVIIKLVSRKSVNRFLNHLRLLHLPIHMFLQLLTREGFQWFVLAKAFSGEMLMKRA